MIKYITGNILDSSAEALVNTVNTVGVMGKGIALQFKKAYHNNYKTYVVVCKKKEIDIGKLLVVKDYKSSFETKIIKEQLENWNDRKRSLFSNPKYIDISVRQLQQAEFV